MKNQVFLCLLAMAVSLVAARDLNAKSLNLIKEVEGWRACAYKDVAGKWTIGYGHLIVANDGLCKPTPTTQCCITQAQGEALLKSDVKAATDCISRIVKVSLTDNEFGALTSWAYNIGCANASSSTLIKKLNAGNKGEVCSELKKWIYAGGQVSQGLINRRNKECNLFTSS